jgi:hypothetical protein
MWPEKFALAVAVVVFIGGSVGLILQRLPERHTTGGPRDMIGAVGGSSRSCPHLVFFCSRKSLYLFQISDA